ncbi:MAG: hypothetical protein WC919_00680 [Candidatus Paceibacterota bacterium]|jgi:hypothetical protein
MKKLRVWWNHPPNKESFYVPVVGLVEAKQILSALADYDNYLVSNGMIGNVSNMGGLEEFDPDDDTEGQEGSWVEWESSDCDNIADISCTEAMRIDNFARMC